MDCFTILKVISFLLLWVVPLANSQSSSHPAIANFSASQLEFESVFGSAASITLIYNASRPLFHEAAIYHQSSDSLFVTSNRIQLPPDQSNPATSNQTIFLHRVTNVSSTDLSQIQLIPMSTAQIPMPNGGTNYPTGSPSDPGILLCSQGTLNQTSGLFAISSPVASPNQSIPVVTSFGPRQLNSPNDAVINPHDGYSIWFTDPTYGYEQRFRPPPTLPSQVYRYDPETNSTRVVADGFLQPNGLAFNSDYTVLYVTDTGVSGFPDGNGPATIYAFDVVYKPGPFLTNRRVFAHALEGIPDGVKVDDMGNVWSTTGTGLTVWSSDGLLLGDVQIEGDTANFGFGVSAAAYGGTMFVFVLNEQRLWRIEYGG